MTGTLVGPKLEEFLADEIDRYQDIHGPLGAIDLTRMAVASFTYLEEEARFYLDLTKIDLNEVATDASSTNFARIATANSFGRYLASREVVA
jgi:hypothetical protein